MSIKEAKAEVSHVLYELIHRADKYYSDGMFIRWGRVERDLHKILEHHLTEPRPEAKESTTRAGH